ncbi:MAG TPA: 4-hydroxy-tetrahydrodipicolinate synthase [Saprospiraceae bacterium]|nr:4-hydroxy-tetrahydrodipicolinate synthase [Saprospiraceae bacterium]
MKQHKFSGTGVALVTPFHQDYSIDYPTLGRLIDHVIEGGVDYIVSLGTTGEAVTLSQKECREVFDYTIEKVNGRCPLVAGLFGSNYTHKLVQAVQEYDFDGFDAIMSSSPAYNKPPQEGIFRHYMALAEASLLPIIIYNVPGRTGSNVEPDTILRLAHASEKFIAVKEASGDLTQGMKIIKDRPDHLAVLSGDDPTALSLMANGGDGVISVIANLYPEHFSSMTNAALRGDFTTAARLNLDLLDLHPYLYVEGNPVGVKSAMEINGLCTSQVRTPLVPLSEQYRKQLKVEMGRVPTLQRV